jgi:hypothetical protein
VISVRSWEWVVIGIVSQWLYQICGYTHYSRDDCFADRFGSQLTEVALSSSSACFEY